MHYQDSCLMGRENPNGLKESRFLVLPGNSRWLASPPVVSSPVMPSQSRHVGWALESQQSGRVDVRHGQQLPLVKPAFGDGTLLHGRNIQEQQASKVSFLEAKVSNPRAHKSLSKTLPSKDTSEVHNCDSAWEVRTGRLGCAMTTGTTGQTCHRQTARILSGWLAGCKPQNEWRGIGHGCNAVAATPKIRNLNPKAPKP